MAEKNKSIQDKLNELKQLRKSIYDNPENNNGVMIYNKVEFLGKGENTGIGLYRVIEEYSVGENRTELKEFFYEYENELPKLIAVRNDQTLGDIIPTEYPGEEGPEKENWDAELLDIEQCLEEKEKELKELAKELGIDEKEINSLSEIELEQKIEENQDEQEKQNEDKTQKISDKEAEKIGIKGNGMNSAKMDTQIDTKGNTLGKELGLEEYDSILVVHSYKLAELNDAEGKKGKNNNINFALVGKKKDGTIEIIPETKLRQYRGANREVTEINSREEVEVKNEECIFEVPNSNKRIAIDQKDPYGIPEIYYGKTDKENEGNVMQSIQDERDGTQRKDVEVRALFNSNKGEYQIDKMHDEVKGHIKAGCNDIDKDEVDGNSATGHQHNVDDKVITPDTVLIYNGKEMPISAIAAEPRFKLSAEEFIEKYNMILDHNGDIDQEEIYDEIEEQVNEETRNPQKR